MKVFNNPRTRGEAMNQFAILYAERFTREG